MSSGKIPQGGALMRVIKRLQNERMDVSRLIPSFKKTLNEVRLYVCFLFVCLFLMEMSCMRINKSDSLHPIFWVGLRGISFKKGDYVLIERDMWGESLLKQVTGMPGDRIAVKGRKLFINGVMAAELSGDLPALVSQTIPEGYVFVSTPHPRGIDSRYQTLGLMAFGDCRAVMWPFLLGASS